VSSWLLALWGVKKHVSLTLQRTLSLTPATAWQVAAVPGECVTGSSPNTYNESLSCKARPSL
jgi:hypothetical protein